MTCGISFKDAAKVAGVAIAVGAAPASIPVGIVSAAIGAALSHIVVESADKVKEKLHTLYTMYQIHTVSKRLTPEKMRLIRENLDRAMQRGR